MTNAKEFFDNLPSSADASKTAGMTNSYLFDIEGAGKWTVRVDNGAINVSAGGENADAIITTSEETFEKIVLIWPATPGIIAPAATATKPAIKAYSIRS